MNKRGKLYLIPVPISEEEGLQHLPELNHTIVNTLQYFISENAKTCRKHLKIFGYPAIDQAQIYELNQHTPINELQGLIKPLLEGDDLGLMSDAGVPGVADPGAPILEMAHHHQIEVIPLTGPSSVLFAVMSSGFNGQNFAFVGYLPRENNALKKRVQELERLCKKEKQAQYFIETPYRNKQLFEFLLKNLTGDTKLYVGINLTGKKSLNKSASVADWKKMSEPEFHKIPAIFGIF
ncbi:MAG: SAM-dependent methyltransferase [Sphingobacteriaceae bacterium]|nr:SAM-dependent methyltransferase [Sphingobacteriaceae bacterium]